MKPPSLSPRLCILTVFLIALCCTRGQAQHRIEVIVSGVKDTTGLIMVALFNRGEEFLKKPTIGRMVKAEDGQAVAVFDGQPAGEYAASIIHDANRNRKLDTNILGLPREGFGFSNDAMGTFGPPSFDKAKFSVAKSISIRIRVKYM